MFIFDMIFHVLPDEIVCSHRLQELLFAAVFFLVSVHGVAGNGYLEDTVVNYPGHNGVTHRSAQDRGAEWLGPTPRTSHPQFSWAKSLVPYRDTYRRPPHKVQESDLEWTLQKILQEI